MLGARVEGRVVVLGRMLSRFRPDTLRTQVEASIRAGTGLRQAEWLLEGPEVTQQSLDALATSIAEWCREEIGRTRRPYGIDQLALAVACAEPGGQPIASATFGVFRPVDFYQEGGVGERVAAFVREAPVDALQRPLVRFAAALFSWGDVARETVYRDRSDE